MSVTRAALSNLSATAAIAAAIVVSPAAAQSGSGGGLEEIVVTAQKREESLQDVPIAVSALTGDTLSDLHVTNIQELHNTLPNVQINTFANSPDSAIFSIRGVGVNDADPYVGTTVSVVVDGVVVGVNTAALVSLFDIDRVEVLRGPQGTLFGANTTGGVINVVTRQPTGELEGEAQVLAGNYGRIEANLAANFPISESWAGKISIMHTGHDGYFKNTLDGSDLGSTDITAVRPYLKYTGESYDATLIGEYVRTRNGSQTNVNFSDSSLILSIPGVTDDPRIRYRRGQSPDQPDQNDRDTYGLTLTQNFSTALGDFVSITNYREYDHDLYSDDDAVEPVWLQTRRQIEHQQFSQELRDSISLTDSVELLAGLFYLNQEYDLIQSGKLDGFLPGLGQPQTQHQESESFSVFSQLFWDLTDRWRFQAGVRFSHESTEARSTTANTFNPSGVATFNDPIIPGSLVVAEGDESWDDVGYKVSLDYRVSDDVLLYGYYARGFKSGGFTGRIVVPQDIGPFDPEQLDTFELGMKADLLDNLLRVNVAAFYNDYTEMKVVQNLTYASGANSASITNAGAATTYGAEVEITWLPVDNLELNVSAAYLNATYDEYDSQAFDAMGNLVPISFAGNDLMNAPEWSTAESIRYTVPLGAGNLEFFVQHTFTDEKYTNFTDLPDELVDSLNLVNGSITFRSASDRWSVGLYGRNLTDEKYYGQKAVFAPAFSIASLGTPLEYGVDFRFNW
jgi:iron complex outermembrane receptor protein